MPGNSVMTITCKQDYDVIIVGAGLVGASLALLLGQSGLKIAVVENHLPDFSTIGNKSDYRPLTLNYSSQLLLAQLKIWPLLSANACPIKEVVVSEQGRFGKVRFQAADFQLPALGYVVPIMEVHQKIYQTAAKLTNISFLSIQNLVHIDSREDEVTAVVMIQDKRVNLKASLLIGADGTHSHTRLLQNIAVDQIKLNQQALIFTLKLKENHRFVAYERFTKKGTLALLPLSDFQHIRLVWTLNHKILQEVSTWNPKQLLDYINSCFASFLGPIQFISQQQNLALEILVAKEQIKPGFVLIGNAAHTLYPLAAQGFNLGLADAAVLAEILILGWNKGQPLGELNLLKKYTDRRLSHQAWVNHFTFSLTQLFEIQLPLAGSLRSLTMTATDFLPIIKTMLGKRLLGLIS